MSQIIVPIKTPIVLNVNLLFYYIRINFDIMQKQNKKQETNKYNKFHMENVQTLATLQLLNIQDENNYFQYYPFKIKLQQDKKKSKLKQFVRTQTSDSSQRHKKIYQKQNNKQFLKNTLKKLLEKQVQNPNLKNIIKRIKTTDGQDNQDSSNIFQQIQTLKQNSVSSRKLEVKNRTFFQIQRINTSLSQKIIKPVIREPLAISLFQQEGERIRKIIKKRIQQKSLQKNKITILGNKVNQNIQNQNLLLNEKLSSVLNKQYASSILNISKLKKNKNLISLNNMMNNEIFLKTIIKSNSKDKENYKGFSAVQTPINRKKQSMYQSRKLKNILF